MNNSLAANSQNLVLTISQSLLSLFPLSWVTYIAKLSKTALFLLKACSRDFSQRKPNCKSLST